MKNSSSKHPCPVCNEPARITKTWSRNKSGKKYEYCIFHHGSTDHTVRTDSYSARRIPKNDARRELLNLLSSTRFKRAIFTVREVVEAINKDVFRMGYYRVSRALFGFVDAKLILVLRRGRALFFINTPAKGQLDYIFKEISIELTDTEDNDLFDRHKYMARIFNDNRYPLKYLQYRAFGDNARYRDKVAFRAYDVTNKENAILYYLGDAPQEKRIIIEFSSPVPPGNERIFELDYFWPEFEPSYTFTASTGLEKLRFSLISQREFSLSVVKTNSSQTDAEDVSRKVTSKDIRKDRKAIEFDDDNIRPFVLFKFKWTPSKLKQFGKEVQQTKEII